MNAPVTGRCARCHQEKPAAQFSPDHWRKSGLHQYCKPCATWRRRRPPVVRRCGFCGHDFAASHARAKYCGPDCQKAAKLRRQLAQVADRILAPLGLNACPSCSCELPPGHVTYRGRK